MPCTRLQRQFYDSKAFGFIWRTFIKHLLCNIQQIPDTSHSLPDSALSAPTWQGSSGKACFAALGSVHPFFFFNQLIYFWLHWVFTAAWRLSLIAPSGDYPLVAVLRLLIVVDSLTAEPRLSSSKFSCPGECGIFLDQGLNSCPLCWQVDS